MVRSDTLKWRNILDDVIKLEKQQEKREKKEKKKTKRIVQAYIYIFGRVHRYTRAIETIYYIETT